MSTCIRGDSIAYMQSQPAGCVDFVLADPPYNDMSLINAAIRESLRVSRNGAAFFMYAESLCSLEIVPNQVLFWVKPISTKNTLKRYSRFVEVITLFNAGFVRTDLHWTNRTGVFTDSLIETPGHPHAKPDALVERLLRNHVPPNGLVLDPFAGSCTVGRVATRIGIEAISVELERCHQ